MSNEKFRRDLNQAFDEVAGSPSSNLRHRVCSAMTAAPAAQRPYWIAGVAAAVIAILLVGVLLINGPLRGSQAPAGLPHQTPSPVASPVPFLCQARDTVTSPPSSGSPAPTVAYISSVQIASHGSYDLLTIQFANGAPMDFQISVLGSGTTFTLSPSGQKATLKGERGILITIHGADLHTAYTGSTDILASGPAIAEVRRIQDFEGVVQLGLGVNGTGCYQASWLSGPDRLVIDVQQSG